MSDIATKLTTIAENQQKVYNAGYAKGDGDGRTAGYNYGWDQGLQQGLSDGKQAEYDRFWDAYFNNPMVSGLAYLFAGTGWNNETFCPPNGAYITSAGCTNKSATMMFIHSTITDLKGICEERNITLDFSATNSFLQTFCDCQLTSVPTIDTRGAASINGLFWNANHITTVEKLILRDDGSQTCSNTFNGLPALESIVIEGKFGKSVDVQKAPKLTKASIISIINALSTTTSGLSITLSKTAVTNAFGSTEADEWTALIATKSNWTISLV